MQKQEKKSGVPRARVVINRELCKGCALCVAFCKPGALRMSAGFNSKGLHFAELAAPEACTGCKNCALICPDAAVEIMRAAAREPADV